MSLTVSDLGPRGTMKLSPLSLARAKTESILSSFPFYTPYLSV